MFPSLNRLLSCHRASQRSVRHFAVQVNEGDVEIFSWREFARWLGRCRGKAPGLKTRATGRRGTARRARARDTARLSTPAPNPNPRLFFLARHPEPAAAGEGSL